MTTWNVAAATAACLLIAGCSAPQAEEPAQRRPQQAGQPMDPLRTAGHLAVARLSALAGDQQGVQRSMDAMSEDLRRAMKLADASRPIDREAARAVARALQGQGHVHIPRMLDDAARTAQQAADGLMRLLRGFVRQGAPGP